MNQQINLRKYALVFVLTVFGLLAVGLGLNLIGFPLPPGLQTWLPPAIAALVIGQKVARTSDVPPSAGAYWKIGLRLTAVAAVLHLIIATVVFVGLSVFAGGNVLGQFAVVGLPGLLIIAGLMVMAIYLSNVAFLWMGVKTTLRAKDRMGRGQ